MVNPNSLKNIEAHKFPKGYKSGNHTQKGPYFLPKLKRFLQKKIRYEDPDTNKVVKGVAGDAVAWRLILSASQGEGWAIREIMDRLDGRPIDAKTDDNRDLMDEEIEVIPKSKDVENRVNKYLQN